MNGLIDKADFYQVGVLDTSQGIAVPATDTLLYDDYPCRFTERDMTDSDLKSFDRIESGSEKYFMVITEPIDLTDDKTYYLIYGGYRYDVVWLRRKYDQSGTYHHLSLKTEKC